MIVCTYEETRTGFSGYCNQYPVYTTGDTLPTLTQNMIAAINLYFEEIDRKQEIKIIEWRRAE